MSNVAQWHVRFGWWSFLAFTAVGLALELFHGFKLPFYMEPGNETRRLMWTLAHAHGTLLSLVHVLFGLSLHALPGLVRRERLISRSLTGATILLPGGFFFGGFVVYSGDPGLSILLVPAGAILLMTAAYFMARGSASANGNAPPSKRP